ncbi:MAG: esterase-like activity of phytase family protein, partial [Devosiaceae bacterium]|nr:esterase-like activity of phytase family protein [Devosiaceae bacterium]
MRASLVSKPFALASIALVTVAMVAPLTSTRAAPVEILAQTIEQYQSRPIGDKIGNLIWRGGLVLEGPDNFGGISGLTFISENQWIAVTDRGQFISGVLSFDRGQIIGLDKVEMVPIRNSSGNPLPRNYSRDAEAIDTIYRYGRPAAIRVSFENLTRVADFDILSARPSGPAREVPIPKWLSDLRTNKSLESACIATDASPIAGSTLLITEDRRSADGAHSGWLLGNRDKGEISLAISPGLNPTDCAFLPNGDLLVLERGTGFLTFTMQIRHIMAADVSPGAVLTGDVILTGTGS